MPTYLYKCNICKREYEAFHLIKTRHAETCCGKQAEILVSPVAIHIFKPFISHELNEGAPLIESKRQYKEELKKAGLKCPAVGVY